MEKGLSRMDICDVWYVYLTKSWSLGMKKIQAKGWAKYTVRLLLIPILATHFFHKFNSCIIFLFYSFKYGSSQCNYWRNWGSVVWRIWVNFLRTFCMSQTQACYQVGKDIGSTSSSWRRSCTLNFHPRRAFILWLIAAQSFCPNPFLPLKHSWLSLANSSC